MKRNIYLIIITVAIFAGCDVRKKDKIATNSTTAKTSIDPPTSIILIDTVHDFGQIDEGAVVEFSYRFRNNGKNPLVVNNVSASCGCTVPEKPEHPIKPGEIGYIKVKFNSEGRPGEVHKTVTVTSNAKPEFPMLQLQGEVIGKQN
jgi:hypothetical protein